MIKICMVWSLFFHKKKLKLNYYENNLIDQDTYEYYDHVRYKFVN